jgi:hypothetical protein
MKYSLFKGELWPVTVAKDFNLLCSKAGRAEIVKERHHRHARDSVLVVAGTVFFGLCAQALFNLCGVNVDLQITTMPVWACGLLGGFYAFVVNAVREAVKQVNGGRFPDGKYIVPFSYRDVRFGTYAGVFTGLLAAVLMIVLL